MAITVRWADETKRVLLQEFNGTWTWDDYDRMVDTMWVMIRSVAHKVNIVGDIRYTAPQHNKCAMMHFQRAYYGIPDNVGKIIVVGKGFFATKLFRMMLDMYRPMRQRVVFAASFDEALHVANGSLEALISFQQPMMQSPV